MDSKNQSILSIPTMNPKVMAILITMIMATIDAVCFPIIKYIHEGSVDIKWMAVPMIIYAIQPLLFYKALKYSNVTIINILWDVSSDIIVTLIGLYLLRETVSFHSKIGLIFAAIAIYFFSKGQLDEQ
jgi:drug/metabolite transporter (DMT)-like permease